jgi:uncharacterized protein involved in exopolysaccharide biosynthesis
MSTQPLAAMLAHQLGALQDSAPTSDLQRMLGRMIAILSRRRWLFVIPLLAGMLGTLVVALLLPRTYGVNTIFERRNDVAISNLVHSNSPYSFETLRRSLVIDVMGYYALGEAADQLGLTDDLPRTAEGALTSSGRAQRQRLLNELAECLRVGEIERSAHLDLIQVSYRGSEPELGLRLVSQLTENYIARMGARLDDILTKSHGFFANEAEQARQRAAALETQLLRMADDHPGVNPSDPDLLSQRIIMQESAIEKLTLDRVETERKLRGMQEYIETLEGGVSPDPSDPNANAQVRQVPNRRRQRIQDQIDRVQTEIADAQALRQMTDHHPHVAALRGKLDRLEEEFAREPATVPEAASAASNRTLEAGERSYQVEKNRVVKEIAVLQERLELFEADLARQQGQLGKLETHKGGQFDRRQQYLLLHNELDTAKAEYRTWKRHMDEVGRILAAEKQNHGISFAVVEPPRRPRQPIAPTVPGIFMLAVGAGVALGVALVFLAEVFDRSIRDPAQAGRVLGVPILEEIGEIVPFGQGRRRARRWLWPTVACAQGMTIVAAGTVFLMSLNDPEWYEQVLGYVHPMQWVMERLST